MKRVNGNCPARLLVQTSDLGLSLTWIKTHCGHELTPFDTRLSVDQREFAASLLEIGLDSSKVQQHIRKNVTPSKLKKQNITSSKDVANCRKLTTIDLQKGRLHEDDPISVDIWALTELAQNDDYHILSYKPQEMLEDGEIEKPTTKIKKQDFILVFMSKWQLELATRMKDMDNIVCMDGTYGLEGYRFNFNVLVIRNPFYRALPIAQMYSSRENSSFITHFLNAVREKVGKIKATHFMSDDAGKK